MAAVYLHIPFCRKACHYCDFHFSTSVHQRDEMIRALVQEMQLRREYLENKPIETIYFGGGTPSLLPPDEIALLIQTTKSIFAMHPSAEITLEANPDDMTADKLSAWSSAGINRLSIGIQSFDDRLLTYMNRAHDAAAANTCLELARAAGFRNISVDLMYGIPGLTKEAWKQAIQHMLSFRPEHWSSYALTIEERTVFGNWTRKGRFHPEQEEVVASQFELLMNLLEEAGYEHYEISNFALPGFHSRHNSSYWKRVHYLGIGPSAHSFNGSTRSYNVRNNSTYINSLAQGQLPLETEHLTRANQINEYILTTLRTHWGCDLRELNNLYGDDLIKRAGTQLTFLESNGWITRQGDVLLLTRSGKLLADRITEELMVEA